MTRIRMVPALLLAAALSCSSASHAQTATPQQVLQQYVSDLQRSPDDTILREKIIRHVLTMKKAPAVPEEARRHFIEGNALLKAAKDQKGYELAIDAYHRCLLIAPWWSEANFNSAVALELANRFDSSMNALKLYIATNPGEEESRKAQDKIYEIGAKKIIAAREREESSPQAVTFEDLLKKIDGRRYTAHGMAEGSHLVIDVRGKVFVTGTIDAYGKYEADVRIEIQGRTTTYPYRIANPSYLSITYAVSEDGDRITRTGRTTGGNFDHIYLWQR